MRENVLAIAQQPLRNFPLLGSVIFPEHAQSRVKFEKNVRNFLVRLVDVHGGGFDLTYSFSLGRAHHRLVAPAQHRAHHEHLRARLRDPLQLQLVFNQGIPKAGNQRQQPRAELLHAEVDDARAVGHARVDVGVELVADVFMGEGGGVVRSLPRLQHHVPGVGAVVLPHEPLDGGEQTFHVSVC